MTTTLIIVIAGASVAIQLKQFKIEPLHDLGHICNRIANMASYRSPHMLCIILTAVNAAVSVRKILGPRLTGKN